MSSAPDATARLLHRHRAVSALGLIALCGLAWIYVLGGAGTGMSAWQMTTATLFPHRASVAAMDMPDMDMGGMEMPGMDMPGMTMPTTEASVPRWGITGALLILAMWWTMMIAMMLPAAAPAILLYAGVRQHHVERTDSGSSIAATGVFTAGYLLVWLLFSAGATALQWSLVRAGWLSAEGMTTQSRALSVALLLAAGIYQLSPLKHRCLAQCRSPAAFFARHWRPGTSGALRLGVLHGAWCVGCCWLLMALLFVGGVMNVVWVAALAVLVLVEKLAPAGPWVGRASGALLIAWGIATLVV